MSIRLGVVGSRDFGHLAGVASYIYDQQDELDCIVSGGARGVDRRAEEVGRQLGLVVVSFRPVEELAGDWRITRHVFCPGWADEVFVLPSHYRSFGAAAFVRNGFIVEFSDAVVAFWDGHSRGTEDSIARARAVGNLRDIVRA